MSIHDSIVVFDLVEQGPGNERAQRILRWIRRNEKTQFTLRECFCKHRAYFETVAAIRPTILLLEEQGYVNRARESKAKNPRSEIYLVAPRWNEEIA